MNIKNLLYSSVFLFTSTAQAQEINKTYAITSDGNGDYTWMNIRQVDIASGQFLQNIYQQNKTAFVMLDAATKMPSTTQNFSVAATTEQVQDAPTASLVAAAAFDKKHNKLFFVPMRIGELRWIDFNAPENTATFYTQKSKLLSTLNLNDEANQITRMDIAADGNGYAITNDGNHLIQFTTGKNANIADLGNLIDAESNNGISIHNRCTSWGGDMIADAYGNLYVISASRNVFKIDISTKMASFMGTITGLPTNFTTNGAAVDADNNIVVSSALSFEGLYKFKMSDFAAVKIEGSNKIYSISDMANGNLLYQKQADAKKSFDLNYLTPSTALNSDAKIFPNPVTAHQFKIVLNALPSGQYTLNLTDIWGRTIMQQAIFISAKISAQTIQLNSSISKGMYWVKVIDATNKIVSTDKLLVQ